MTRGRHEAAAFYMEDREFEDFAFNNINQEQWKAFVQEHDEAKHPVSFPILKFLFNAIPQ
jgi:hypothetical protein